MFDRKIGFSRSHRDTEMQENEMGTAIVDGAVHLHQDLGPGPRETLYSCQQHRTLTHPLCLRASVRQSRSNQPLNVSGRLTFPELVRRALRQWLTKRVDQRESCVPGFVTSVDRDAVVDELSENRAFSFIDSPIECLAVFDKRAKLSVLLRRHVN